MLRTRMPLLKAPTPGRAATSMLFDLRAADVARSGVIVARSGDVATFTRASAAQLVDGAGRPVDVPHTFARVDMLDLDGDGIRESAALVLERATTNRVKRSSDFSDAATWVPTSAPTRVAAAASAGSVLLDLLGDTDAGATSLYGQSVVFVGNGSKVVSLYVKKGLAPAASGSRVLLTDTTAPADRANGVLTFSGAGVPALAMATGTYLTHDTEALANGIYRIKVLAPGVVAANTNVLRVTPAQVLAEQGNVYVGGVQCEDNASATSLRPTSNAVTPRSADLVSFAINMPPVIPCTLYGELVLPDAAQGRTDTLVRIGTSDLTDDAQNALGIYRDAGSNLVARAVAGATHHDASVALGASGATSKRRFLAVFDGVNVSLSVDGGAAVVVAGAAPASFAVNRLDLPGDNGARWLVLKLAAGARSDAQMRVA